MANPEHLNLLKQGVDQWNAWRKEHREVEPDLRGADLRGAKLRGAHLFGAYLARVDLRESDLRTAWLNEANLSEAKLGGAYLNNTKLHAARLGQANLSQAHISLADLSGANLSGANFSGANLSGANLSGANFSGANLHEANIEKAHLVETVFANTNLKRAQNLDRCDHRGPSTLDHRTLARNPHLPIEFLRGCGLSDWEIESAKLYRPDLGNNQINDIVYKLFDLRATQAIQINPLFISYNHDDGDFVDYLENYLIWKGIRFWRDTYHATAGRLEKVVDRAIRHNPTVLLVLSEHSVNSDWVEYEVEKARELEKELHRDVLCPVRLDDSWKTAPWSAVLMNQVKKYHILDFSVWQDRAAFEAQFDKLLRGLRIFYEEG